jgi:hypothetical protein
VFNAVLVEGARGTDQDGVRFAYSYETASPDAHPAIPDPPGVAVLSLSSSLLVSDELCEIVGGIAEVNHANATTIEWETWPVALKPGDVVQLTASTVGFTGLLFVTGFSYDVDGAGYRMRVTGWAGTDTAFTETDDPNPTEDDDEPTDPRPGDEWLPYKPLGTVA